MKGNSDSTNGQAKASAEAFQIESMNSAEFFAKKFRREWLIQGVLVRGQPGVIGGPKKTLKTSLAVDMAISIGSGGRFLGEFAAPKPRRVAVLCGESDGATVQETAARICKSKGVSPSMCGVEWSSTLPMLSRPGHRRALRRFLRDKEIQVVFIDPLYLCLLSGTKSASASNLYEIGPLLWVAARACLDAGATPLIVHHATKRAGKKSAEGARPTELDDLAFAGVAEFVRQWVLLSRREPYGDPPGRHRLLMNVGGSAGHSGLWKVDVDEGVLDDGFAGRKWKVHVESAAGASAVAQQGRGGLRRSAPGNAPHEEV